MELQRRTYIKSVKSVDLSGSERFLTCWISMGLTLCVQCKPDGLWCVFVCVCRGEWQRSNSTYMHTHTHIVCVHVCTVCLFVCVWETENWPPNHLGKLCFLVFTFLKSIVSSHDWGGEAESMVATVTIDHSLALPLCLVVDKIAPYAHQDSSLCASWTGEKQQQTKNTYLSSYSSATPTQLNILHWKH